MPSSAVRTALFTEILFFFINILHLHKSAICFNYHDKINALYKIIQNIEERRMQIPVTYPSFTIEHQTFLSIKFFPRSEWIQTLGNCF
jgi:hypothetical protein